MKGEKKGINKWVNTEEQIIKSIKHLIEIQTIEKNSIQIDKMQVNKKWIRKC